MHQQLSLVGFVASGNKGLARLKMDCGRILSTFPMPPRFIAKQLSRPSGLFAPIISWLMNRHNAKLNAFALDQLRLTRADRVLEIGFGGGLNLPFLIERAAFTAGLDRSPEIVKRANARFRDQIRAGRAEFREGHIEHIPFETGSFTRVCTVNTVYFWSSLDAGCAEIRRVLTPEGAAIIGFLPKTHMDKMKMPGDIFTSRTEDEVIAALRRNGFANAQITRPTPQTAWAVAVASA
ncbi:class I SAM-dependent methyltransferase [Occallatibacter savannae]|uniref:class I SAM-dependent methyltransferase n=1 Tax=Occallatibacter savannae TaxID=1002691 RepID=UPI000D69D4A7|nr:class I SAM-dependent methyltransferase [Occallatibacter savannae]